jgi:NADH:ubiquinone oxidoreductase subunit D
VEQLLGIELTPRCIVLRTLLSEYNRIADHVTCVAASVMEMGGMTAFLYLMTVRDYIFEHLNHAHGRAADVFVRAHRRLARDVPDGWLERLEEILQSSPRVRGTHPRHARPQPHLHRPHAQRGVMHADARAELGLHRPHPAFHRPGDGPAQGQALPGLRRPGL